MAFIDWSEDFSTGIPSIDDQHRHLVEIVNRFDEASRRGKGTRVMQDILNDLLGYTQEHFAHEESLMAAAGYEGLAKHQTLHRQLLQKVERCQYEFEQGGRRVTAEVRELLRYWVESHLMGEDQAFADTFREAVEESLV
jgi:hemerythrin